MSIDEYNEKFVHLARYAPHVVSDEKHQIREFILGLHQPFYVVISLQVNVFLSYAVVVEAT